MTSACPPRASASSRFLPAVGRRLAVSSALLVVVCGVAAALLVAGAFSASAQEPPSRGRGEPLTVPGLVPRAAGPLPSPLADWTAAYELGPRDRVSVAVFGQAPLSGRRIRVGLDFVLRQDDTVHVGTRWF